MYTQHPSCLTSITCLECGHQFEYAPGCDTCPACRGGWLDARYDYARVAKIWREGLTGRVASLWRYAELLPIGPEAEIVTMGEGFTPLIRAAKLQQRLGHPAIFIKDERQSPTSSFKDRQAAVAVTDMRAAGITECVLASTGNAAAAYSAYCARADIKLWVFLTSLVPAPKMREAALYGAEVIKVTGTYDQAKKVSADFAVRRGIRLDKGAKAVPGKESMKTVAYEIAEQLALELSPSGGARWLAPDWYLQAVSGGIGPLGVHKGFEELYQMGLIDRVPKIGVVQVSGCAPMVRAFEAHLPKAAPVVPETRITILSTGEPGLSYELLYQASQKYGGHMISVSDDEAFSAMRHLAKTEGYSVEPATAVAFAGLDKMVSQGIIKPGETVVVNCSGHTFPVEKHIMSDEHLLDVRLSHPAEAGVPLDGLGAALEQLDAQVTTIVVIDDNPTDTLLIRRLLQRQKPYRVFEAHSAVEGWQVILDRQPDLVVTDLTMPEMDGFALLEKLKANPKTADIPVIVVSAKDLTPEDERKLAGQTSSIWLKGAYTGRELVEHVVDLLSGADADSGPATPVEPPASQSPAAPPPSPAKTVVLVDDNPTDARLLSRILQAKLPVAVKEVYAGGEAIDVIRAEKPCVIILDLVLPDKNGFEILDELKADSTLNAIPVVVVTSKELTDHEEMVLRANGVFSVWYKDRIDRDRLIAQIESQLEKA